MIYGDKYKGSENMIDIENIRNDAIIEIKEKVKKNHRYLHPCNKERLEDMKRFKFANGNDFTCWMQQNGIMKNPIDIKHEEFYNTIKNSGCENLNDYKDKCAKKLGYKDRKERGKEYNMNHVEYKREWNWNHGICSPFSENEYCSLYLGVHIAERNVARKYLPILLGEIEKEMPPNYPAYDFVCKGCIKVNVKARQLIDNKWQFPIKHNNIADYFILICFDNINDNRELKILHILIIGKNDMVRKHTTGKYYIMEKFYNRETISISNDPKSTLFFKHFQKYDWIDKLSTKKYILVEEE